ncbi:MAG: dipeptidase [Pseudomonadota bacterium]
MTDPVPVFDGHNDTILKLEIAARLGEPEGFVEGNPALDIDLPRARAAGFAGGLFAMYTPSALDRLAERPEQDDPARYAPVAQEPALNFTLAMFARLRRLAAGHPGKITLCASAAEARAAMAAGRLAVVPHIEGAECIAPDLSTLEVLHAAGLRSLGLVWSRPNAFGHGAPMEADPDLDPGEGLTDAGKALVAACNRLRVQIDCSHLTEAGFWDVARLTDAPLIASHSNVHAISPSARNLTDNQLAAIGESGGLVGLNFNVGFLREDCGEADTPITQMLRHLDHLLEVLGETGVALGSDFDGCQLPEEIGDVTGLPRLIAAMRQAGYGEALIARICRENWLDALDRAQIGC